MNRAFLLQAESGEDLDKFASYSDASASAATTSVSKPTETAYEPTPAPMTSSTVKGNIGPAVKKLLAESGLNVSQIQGTGPGGMIIKGDVLAAIKGGMKPLAGDKAGDKVKGAAAQTDAAAPKSAPSKAPTPDTSLTFEDIPNTPIRKVSHSVLGLDSGCHCRILLDFYLSFMCRFIKKYGFFPV